MPRLRLACSLLILAAALPATAAADTDWVRVSNPGQSPGGPVPLELARDGDAVVGVWVVASGTFRSLESVRFTPSRADEAAGLLTVRPPSLANWDFMNATLLAAPAGGAQVLFTGQLNLNTNAPSGTNLTPLLPTGDVGGMFVPTSPRTADMLQAILTAAGPVWVGSSGSTLYTFREGLNPAYQITGNLIPGCCGYDPRLGLDTSGRLWLAFYSNATGAIGEWMVQLDPATGQPVPGTAEKAPLSETSDNNNGYGVGFACAAVCRIAYEETDTSLGITSGRIVTWAPGEAPTVVGGSRGGDVGTPTIAYRPDGRLWVAWVDRRARRVVAKLGTGPNASRGEGGVVMNAGSPPLPTTNPFLYGLESLPIGNDLLLDVSAGFDAQQIAQYVNLVLEPGAIDTSGIPNPQVTPKSPGGRIVYPGTVTPVELGPNRCVRVKPVADKPARIWAQIFSGRRNGTPVSTRVSFRFTAPGSASKCMTLQKKAAGFYKGKYYRIKFEVRTGANPKPAERSRPPWRTQPRIIIDA